MDEKELEEITLTAIVSTDIQVPSGEMQVQTNTIPLMNAMQIEVFDFVSKTNAEAAREKLESFVERDKASPDGVTAVTGQASGEGWYAGLQFPLS